MSNKKQGFTLVELSIVIIIIGFLVAGVATGTSLITQAQVSTVISQMTSFITAEQGFYGRYNAIPGDFANGYQYWNGIGNCTNTFVNDPPYNGCNGDGAGNLGPGNHNQKANLFWFQLNWSGFLSNGPTDISQLGFAPSGPYPNSGYYAQYDSYWGVVPQQDQISFGKDTWIAMMPSADAKNIDLKMDDGYPNSGRILAGSASGAIGHCINGSGPEDTVGATDYVVSNPDISCRMIFLLPDSQWE